MSSDPVISVQGISKFFATSRRPIQRLQDALRGRPSDTTSGHWALRDVSFDLRRGETLGIMGRNGCGKSTLLEIIAGTLTPTAGKVQLGGDFAALLELGAGFSTELTGRENVFVYGSLLGMTRETIRSRFDDIVAFSELGDFIDEPVKNYSSGMFVRLAFATAISATPEILIIDEALAVGDESFQRKCYARIEEMKQSGVSILFVSHAAGTVVELCDRVLLLDRGESLLLGSPGEVVRQYHRMIFAVPDQQEALRNAIRSGEAESSAADAPAASGSPNQSAGSEEGLGIDPVHPLEAAGFDPALESKSRLDYPERGARIVSPSIENDDREQANRLVRGERYFICFRVDFARDAYGVRPGTLVKNVIGADLGGVVSNPRGQGLEFVAAGDSLEVRLPIVIRLVPGTYFANVGVVALEGHEEVHLHRITDALAFRVVDEEESRVTGSVDLSTDELAELRITQASE